MKISLIRHAETPGNLRSCYVGCTDEPLAPEGIATAGRVRRNGSVDRVYTSSLVRTIQTAGIIYPNAGILPRSGLDEMNFGQFEGKNWKDLEDDAQYAAWVASGCEEKCPGGEGRDGFARRCVKTFLSVVREQGEEGAKTLHCVVHGGVIMAIMSELVDPSRGYFSWKAGFCGGFVIGTSTDATRFQLLESLPSPNAGKSK